MMFSNGILARGSQESPDSTFGLSPLPRPSSKAGICIKEAMTGNWEARGSLTVHAKPQCRGQR